MYFLTFICRFVIRLTIVLCCILGSLVLDEMKLTPNLSFDRKDLKFIGFTDLGDYTPDNQKNQQGDHALVLIFQPFVGKWVQTVATFLSRGAASSKVLEKIILEAILLLENSGFQVDSVITDGAAWNRCVWRLMGMDNNKDISTPHPYDLNRRLWFISDFPHLIKNLRNWMLKAKTFNVR